MNQDNAGGKVAAGVLAVALTVAGAWAKMHEGSTYIAIQPVPGDPWTLCFGHTKGVKQGQRATMAQCEAWLKEDLLDANATVDSCITGRMTINQRAALIDFALNLGAGAPGVKDGLCWLKSGDLPYIRRMANVENWQAACNGFMEWTKARGVEYRGLAIRRQHERELCLSDYFADVRSGVSTYPASTLTKPKLIDNSNEIRD